MEVKKIIRSVIIGVLISVIMMFIRSCKVSAYVYVKTVNPIYGFAAQSDSRIVNPSQSWGSGKKMSNFLNEDPWIIDVGQFSYVSNVSGTYLSVNADYYFGMSFNTDDPNFFASYFSSERNPLKVSNLRCGLADAYGTGYDSTFAPNITNFSVTYSDGYNSIDEEFYHVTFHIKFEYFQQIQRRTGYTGNFSCWFERNPDNGLLGQIEDYYTSSTEFYSYTKNLSFNLSLDPNTAILDSIESQNDTIIDQNEQIINGQDKINDSVEDINDSINNDDVDTEGAGSFFSDFSTVNHGGISGVITAPLSAISKITDKCSPYSFTIKDQVVELPCGDTLFWDKAGYEPLKVIWNIIFGGGIIYALVCKLFKVIQNLKNPDDDRVEMINL